MRKINRDNLDKELNNEFNKTRANFSLMSKIYNKAKRFKNHENQTAAKVLYIFTYSWLRLKDYMEKNQPISEVFDVLFTSQFRPAMMIEGIWERKNGKQQRAWNPILSDIKTEEEKDLLKLFRRIDEILQGHQYQVRLKLAIENAAAFAEDKNLSKEQKYLLIANQDATISNWYGDKFRRRAIRKIMKDVGSALPLTKIYTDQGVLEKEQVLFNINGAP